METQQKKNATKTKWSGRRFIDGLFGNRNSRQQLDREEELQLLLQNYERLVKEQEDKLSYCAVIGQQATDTIARLVKMLNELMQDDAPPHQYDTCATMLADAELLSNLIQQLQPDALYINNNVLEPTSPTIPTSPTSPTTPTPPTSPTTPTKPAPPQLSKRPVLILATQDEAIGQRLNAMLHHDYSIRKCSNGWQVLAEAYRNGANAIVAEAQMDTMDGITMCSRLRSNPQTSLIPVILITDDETQRLQALQQGADMCIAASAETGVITYSVNNLLKGRRQMQLNYEQQRRVEKHEAPELNKKKSANEKLMERIMDTIYKNLTDSSLNVDKIADEVGMSRVHLHRKMKEIVGQTPHDFIRQLRMERATRLLAAGDMNITEVVYACGFSNAASFSTTFKHVYGLTPSEYMAEKQKAGT